MRLTFQQRKKCNSRNYKILLKMDLSDKEVLLESCCFLLTYYQEQIKRKRKWTWVREILKKRIEQGVYHNLLQDMHLNDRESYFRLFV